MSRNPNGWVCAHTHVYSGLAALGLPQQPVPEPAGLLQILERVWWRLDRALDEPSLVASARLYVAEALLSGTTALVDHHESPAFIEGSLDVIADACQELGMRALLCYGATERNGGRAEARRGLDECARFLETNRRPLVRGAIGLHACFTVSDETLAEAGALARSTGAVVHVHMAEDANDRRDAEARGYAGPLQRLLTVCDPPPGSILAHGVDLTPEEVRCCAERELWLVQNPRSNRNNGVGYPGALRESDTVALGADGFPADMVDEAEMLILEAAAHGDDLRRAVQRLGNGQRLINERFNGGEGPRVELSLGRLEVDGRAVVVDGELRTGDLVEIRARAQEEAPRLWSRMEAIA